MSRIDQVFQTASQAQRMTFMPFVTAGDPSTAGTAEVLKALRDAEVDLIELGFPYSDPIADGPVIQASYTRSLDSGVTVTSILDMVESLRDQQLPPILAMVSFAIIFRYGTEKFVARAAEAGFSGLIVPDLPADEADELAASAKAHHLDLVQLIAPTTAPERVQQILKASSGFVYCVSVAGTTGARKELPVELIQQLKQLRQATSLPLAVGFGISGPDQVAALEGVADGVIVGSAIVKQISEAPSIQQACDSVKQFSQSMRNAVDHVKPSLKS